MAIGSFRRLEEIGRGSFATVYKAAYTVSSYPVENTVLLTAGSFETLHSLHGSG
jgi:hypothetical protein